MTRVHDRHPERVYIGQRTPAGARVWVAFPGGGRWLRVHTPQGFPAPKSTEHEWGYGGSGPAQLAHDLILDATGDRQQAAQWMQEYKWEVTSRLPHFRWTLLREAVEIVLDRLRERAAYDAQDWPWHPEDRIELADDQCDLGADLEPPWEE